MKTEFNDKSGKPLCTGDLVQYRLNSSSATLLKVIKTKKGIKLVDPKYTGTYGQQTYKGSILVNKTYEKYISIVDISAREP